MPYKPLTHEAFHTGLSAMGNDQKWSDMINFRSQNGRTRTIPRKFELVGATNLHTVINLGKQVNYALGADSSFIFAGNDALGSYVLWKVKVTHDTDDADAPRNLPVRGHFTGGEPKTFSITLTKPTVTPETPATPETPSIECYGCCDGGVVTIFGTNKLGGGAGIPGGVVNIFQNGALVQRVVPNGGGLWRVNLPIGYYYLTIDIPGYHQYFQPLNVAAAEDIEFIVMEETEPVHYLQVGTRILLYVSPALGPMEDAPTGFSINGVDTMNGTWDPPGSDPGVLTYVLTNLDMAQIWAAQAPDVDEYVFVFPEIDTAVYTGYQIFDPFNVLITQDFDGEAETITLPEA